MTVAPAGPAAVRTARPGRRHALAGAAAGLAVAAAVHATALPEHLRDWWPARVFFFVVAAGQAWLALSLLRRPYPATLLAAIWSSVTVIGVYCWSRLAALPFVPVRPVDEHGAAGEHVGHAVGGRGNGVPVFSAQGTTSAAEPVGVPDLVALAAELAVIAILLLLLPDRARRWTGNALLGCGLALLALRLTVLT